MMRAFTSPCSAWRNSAKVRGGAAMMTAFTLRSRTSFSNASATMRAKRCSSSSCQSVGSTALRRSRALALGNVTITSIVERDGPWRRPEDMFRAYDPDAGRRHLAELDPEVFDPVSGRLVITYRTYVVRTPKHTILVDTCTGEDKGYAPPMDFPKQPWLDGFRDARLAFDKIDYVFCTHLHIDHCGWNTVLRNGRWVPTFPNAKYVFHKREYSAWEEATQRGETPPGNG